MRFGIYCEIQTPPGKPHYDMTWEIMRQIEHADECGFDVYSVIDHHFFQKFSISANPLAMFAAAAQRTKRIRFRTALHTVPLENPMRLAGMIAETDILTMAVWNAGWDEDMPGCLVPRHCRSKKAVRDTTRRLTFLNWHSRKRSSRTKANTTK